MPNKTGVARARKRLNWGCLGRFALVLIAAEVVCTVFIGFGPIQLAVVLGINGYGWLNGHVSNPVAMYHRAHLQEKMPDPRVVSAGNALGW